MENIGTGGEAGTGLEHHSNYNCDIRNLVTSGQVNSHLRHQQPVLHHSHHQLSLHDREKNFSVNHLLELPGQTGHNHMYQSSAQIPDNINSDLHRASVEHHHRISNQPLKLQEGRNVKWKLQPMLKDLMFNLSKVKIFCLGKPSKKWWEGDNLKT